MAKNLKTITAEIFFFSYELAVYVFLGLQKDVQATGEAFNPQKKHPALQNMKFFF